MAKERTSVRMQAQIKIMSEQGHSIRSIARVLKLSRRTVRRYLEPVLQWPSENGGLGGRAASAAGCPGGLRQGIHFQERRQKGGHGHSLVQFLRGALGATRLPNS